MTKQIRALCSSGLQASFPGIVPGLLKSYLYPDY